MTRRLAQGSEFAAIRFCQ